MATEDDTETETAPETKPEHTPENPAPEVPARDDVLSALESRVTALEGTLSTIVQISPDTTPTKVPWTHRKFGGNR